MEYREILVLNNQEIIEAVELYLLAKNENFRVDRLRGVDIDNLVVTVIRKKD